MSELRLHTVLEPMGPAGAIVLDDEQVAQLSTAKAFPVVVTIGEHTGRLRLARMGGKNLIGFSKAVRAEMGVAPGDEIEQGRSKQDKRHPERHECRPQRHGPLADGGGSRGIDQGRTGNDYAKDLASGSSWGSQ